MKKIKLFSEKKEWIGIALTFMVLFSAGQSFASDPVLVDSDKSEVTVLLVPEEPVDLKLKSEVDKKIWILLESDLLFPEIRFARPNDPYVVQHNSYLAVFSQNGQVVPDAANLYYFESSPVSKVDFGINTLTGIGNLTLYSKKGEDPTNLDTIQKITLLDPGSQKFYDRLMDDIEDLFDDATDIDIPNPF